MMRSLVGVILIGTVTWTKWNTPAWTLQWKAASLAFIVFSAAMFVNDLKQYRSLTAQMRTADVS